MRAPPSRRRADRLIAGESVPTAARACRPEIPDGRPLCFGVMPPGEKAALFSTEWWKTREGFAAVPARRVCRNRRGGYPLPLHLRIPRHSAAKNAPFHATAWNGAMHYGSGQAVLFQPDHQGRLFRLDAPCTHREYQNGQQREDHQPYR